MLAVKHTIQPLKSATQTAAEMERLVRTYSKDLGVKAKWNLPRIYDHVRALPFRADPQGAETVSRPALTLQTDFPWRDCDDKAIILGSWCFENKIPFFFRASSKHPSGRLHHVYAVCKIKGKEIPLDATYPRNKLGIEEPYTKIQNLSGEIKMNSLNTLEGDFDQELLGFNPVRRIKRAVKNSVRNPSSIAKSAAIAPFYATKVGYDAFVKKQPKANPNYKLPFAKKTAATGTGLNMDEAKKYKALQDSILKAGKIKGTIMLSLPGTLAGDELGAWYSNLGRKAGNIAKKAGKVGKKVATSSAVQSGLNAFMPGAGSALSSILNKGKGAISDMGTALDDREKFYKMAKYGGFGLAAAAVLYLVLRRK